MTGYYGVRRTFGDGFVVYPTEPEQELAGAIFDRGVAVTGALLGTAIGAGISGLRRLAQNAQDRVFRDLIDRMETAARTADFVQLLQLSREFTRRFPDIAQGFVFLASALSARKDFEGAEAAIERAVSLGLPEVDAHAFRADMFERSGRTGPAIVEYSILIRHPETRDVALWNRALALAAIGDLDLALADIDTAVSEMPDAMNYAARGRIRMDREEYAMAVDDLTRAYRLAPDWPELLEQRADCHDFLGAHDKATADREQAADWMNFTDSSSRRTRPDRDGSPDGGIDPQEFIERLFKKGIYLRVENRLVVATEPLDADDAETLSRLQDALLEKLAADY